MKETVMTQNFKSPPEAILERIETGIGLLERKMQHLEYENKVELGPVDNTVNKTFQKFLHTGEIETKSLVMTSRGGVLIPKTASMLLQKQLEDLSSLRANCRNVSVTRSPLELVVPIQELNAFWLESEHGHANKDSKEAEFKLLPINTHELYVRLCCSQRLIDESGIDLQAWLLEQASWQINTTEAKAFLYGDGKNQPMGMLKNDKVTKTAVKSDDLINDLITMQHRLAAPYFRNAKWLMHPSVLAMIKKTPSENGFLWQNDPHHLNINGHLLGSPILLSSDMPAAPQQDEIFIAFGDFHQAYVIVDSKDNTIVRDPYTRKPHVEFYISKRVGGEVVDSKALVFATLSVAA